MAAAVLAGPVDRLLWVDPYPTRLPRLTDLRRPSDVPRVPDVPITGVDVLSPFALPLEPIGVGRWFNRHTFLSAVRKRIESWLEDDAFAIGIGKPSPLAIEALRSIGRNGRCSGRFYDAMDRYANFYDGISSQAMARWEAEVLLLSDWVQTSSTALRAEMSTRRKSVRLSLNGIDPTAVEEARRIRKMPVARDKREIVFGYIGTMGAWFDWQWTFELAGLLTRIDPLARIVLIGPVYARPSMAIPPNVEIHEPVSHAEALRAAAAFDVGIIPFMQTPLTECVDPIKYYEYRGLGLPVLATSFGELRYKTDPCLVLAEPDADLMERARRALELRDKAAEPRPLAECAWSSRFAPLESWLYSLGRRVEAGEVSGQPACTIS